MNYTAPLSHRSNRLPLLFSFFLRQERFISLLLGVVSSSPSVVVFPLLDPQPLLLLRLRLLLRCEWERHRRRCISLSLGSHQSRQTNRIVICNTHVLYRGEIKLGQTLVRLRFSKTVAQSNVDEACD
ncbi:uncharacterized protein LOC109728019 [Ananas comosus]|uniref:Uncharacterized protein LOC109728019 n=1 Tax=Ananas comosus TaxID=4615 RepID=A0A6P5HDT7_ANACO|nr:uncharacterized protein LOC109728019 [Ananas comosus]